jgi:hypothetical protein
MIIKEISYSSQLVKYRPLKEDSRVNSQLSFLILFILAKKNYNNKNEKDIYFLVKILFGIVRLSVLYIRRSLYFCAHLKPPNIHSFNLKFRTKESITIALDFSIVGLNYIFTHISNKLMYIFGVRTEEW